MPRFEFHFDFGSPNAYLAHKAMAGIVRRTGLDCVYVPVLLGGVFKATNNRSPMERDAEVLNKNEYAALETARFVARHGLDKYTRNPHFPLNTIQIMRGAIAAARDGRGRPYIDAVFAHMWEQQLKMDDAGVIAQALDQAGFDGAAIAAAIQEQSIKDELIANTEASVARGTFGSPTFFIDDDIYFGKDRLREVEEELVRRGQEKLR